MVSVAVKICQIDFQDATNNKMHSVNHIGMLLLYLTQELHKVVSNRDVGLRELTIFVKYFHCLGSLSAAWRCEGRELYSLVIIVSLSVSLLS